MSGLNYRSVGLDGEPWPAWVRELKKSSGVYVIKNHGDDGRVLYVGSSASHLYDTISRHFQQWKRQKNWWKGLHGAHHDPGMTYRRSLVCIAVRITPKGDHFEAEAELIQRLKPRDNLVEHPDGGDEEKIPF